VLWDFDVHVTPHLPDFLVCEGSFYLPWQMVLYLAAGLIGGIVVSRLTKPVPEAKLDRFYALVRTPVVPGEQVAMPCTLPEGVPVPQRHNLFPNTSLELPVPGRMGILGFLAGWACVVVLVLIMYAIAPM